MVRELADLVALITRWIKAGLRTDEILARLSDPDGVGRYLIERAAERRAAGAEYLGRGGTDEDV
jgi:hypothetical protein